MVALTDAQIETVFSAVTAEVQFRGRNPHTGRVTFYSSHLGDCVDCPSDEVGYVAFERDGMNTVETGKTTFIVKDDGAIGFGPTRDYAMTAKAGRESFSAARFSQ